MDEDFDFLGDDDADPDGPPRFEEPIEPGSPSLENALFVLLGALSVLAVVVRATGLLG